MRRPTKAHLQPEREAVRSARVVDVVEGDVPERKANVITRVGRRSLMNVASCTLTARAALHRSALRVASQHRALRIARCMLRTTSCAPTGGKANGINRGCDGMQNGAQRATCVMRHKAWHVQLWMCSIQHAAYNMQHTTCSIQHAAYNMRHETCNKRRARDAQHTTRNARQPPVRFVG